MTMMNDMIHIGCEELITEADEAQMEHERGECEREERERWEAVEATHGPLHGPLGWWYSAYDGMAWKD